MLLESKPQTPSQRSLLFTTSPKSLIQNTKRLIEDSRKVQDEITRTVQPEIATFANTLLPLAQNENQVALESHIIEFYQAVASDSALRDASNEAKKLFSDFGTETATREDLFVLVDVVMKNSQDEELDIESRLFLQKEHKKYLANGLGLPPCTERETFSSIKKRLSELSIAFQKNLNEEDSGIWFTPQELDGVPGDVLERLEKGQDDGPNKGKLRLTFQYPDYFPTMNYAKDGGIRKKVFLGFENKCNQNVPLFKETIILRDKAARLLGYPDHATFRLEDKMITSPSMVNSFLDGLRAKLVARGREEIEMLKQLKKADLGVETYDDHYYIWDHRFYHRMMLEQQFSVDHQKIAEYFPLDTVIRAMLGVFESLFGLVFSGIDPEDEVHAAAGIQPGHTWHEDVQVFSVWDDKAEGGQFVGYLYLDLYPRQGKFSHAANFNVQPGFSDEDGNRRYPATALVCNFSRPTPEKPSLLKHEELVMLFHELGHGIHDLVSKTTYARFHGTMTVQDFCEAPSQMLENWCWDPEQLQRLSQHYLTGERIPEDMIRNLIHSKNVNSGLFYLRQLHLSTFDMMIHQPESHAAIERVDSSELYNSMWEEITQLEGPKVQGVKRHDWGHGDVTFFHLMGDYDAGYYGYLISKVYALDMFDEVFKSDPMNPGKGRRYRRMVLEKGGSQPEMKMLVDFLGREPKTEAFYKDLGLGQERSI